ncbi:glucose-1-phosphate thymidylyltransferase [Candidatus Nitrosotenuis aquarius]|uniref:glucose-1-phosphate thymidylyltransferase n=1 Tax=Candidatus Nitrosotenuis aquarius TaxID=1846278 RepID=UPI000C1F5DA1|nr:glucose-1-phosphate thymidylyltransferase [Candidatus Nitrosotenuis aquarius]
MKGILLHGGHGTRLRPLTHTGPKQLLPIANKPMSQYCLESIRDAGATEIAIIIGGIGSNKVKEYYADGKKFGVKITYVEQEYPKGIAHAIRLCKDFIGSEKFLVFLGDNIIQKSILDYAKDFEKSDAEASILLCEVDEPSRFGIADMRDGKITKIMEKPQKPPTNLAVTGIYFLTPKIFEIIDRLKPSWRNELEITDALQMLLEEGNKITYHTITDYWKDTGTPDDIIHANKAILQSMKPYFHGKKDDAHVTGNVMVGMNTQIHNSKIGGPVIIGNNCVIDGVNIGPNTSIGDNTKLSYCNISDSIIMSNCILSGNLKIRKSIIAANSNIILEDDSDEKVFLLGEGTRITL